MQINNPNSLNGIDVSQFQGNINFIEVRKGQDFVIVRASSSSTGIFNIDTNFVTNITSSRAQGIPVGTYHFAGITTNLQDARDQANAYADLLEQGFGAGDYGDIMPVVDVEQTIGVVSDDGVLDWVDEFRVTFEARTGRTLMIYAPIFFIQATNNFQHSTKGFLLSDMPLWTAYYLAINPDDRPPDAGNWTEWRIWQYADDGTVSGITGPALLDFGPDSIDFLVPPDNVTGFKAKPDSNSITLSWDANNDLDLNHYNIYQFGTKIAEIPSGTEIHIVEGLENGFAYTFEIEAVDADGEESVSRTEVIGTPNEQLLKITWTPPANSPQGDPIEFGAGVGPFIIRNISGEGTTSVTEQVSKSPFQVGVSLFNTDVNARIVTLQIRCHARNRTEMFELRSKITSAFAFEPQLSFDPLNLFNAGQLKYFKQEFEGEKELVLDAIPRESPQFSHVTGSNYTFDADIEFFCPYPFWTDTTENIQNFPDSGGLQFPLQLPFEIAQLTGTITIQNNGDVSAPPIFEINGELADVTIQNLTTGKQIKINGTINQFEKVTVFTEFGKKRIIFTNKAGNESNAIDRLDLDVSDFWTLKKGANTITVSSTNVNGSIFVKWKNRFAGV